MPSEMIHPDSASASPVLAEFLRTRVPATSSKYFDALKNLRPDHLSLDDISEIVEWIEKRKKPQPDFGDHINVFGTGGDGTINVSSMAAILASRLTRIIKVGTPGVTSRFGSDDFFDALRIHLSNIDPSEKREPMHFSHGSGYLSLADLGFPYNPHLRLARRRLKEEGVPDIYKVVFPFANYTNPRIQVNGVSTKVYRDIFDRLAIKLKRPVCIVHSAHGIDEIMPGKNSILFVSDVRRIEMEWNFATDYPGQVWTAFSEKETACQTVELFEQIMFGYAPQIVTETILENAALLIASHRMVESSSLDFAGILGAVCGEMRSLISLRSRGGGHRYEYR